MRPILLSISRTGFPDRMGVQPPNVFPPVWPVSGLMPFYPETITDKEEHAESLSVAPPRSQYYANERRNALSRDGYTCQYCDEIPAAPTADHIHPRSRGGSDDRHNLACACHYCNGRKGRRTPDEWYAILQQIAKHDIRPAHRLFAVKVMSNLEARFNVQPDKPAGLSFLKSAMNVRGISP